MYFCTREENFYWFRQDLYSVKKYFQVYKEAVGIFALNFTLTQG
jgi:hypothetical protein